MSDSGMGRHCAPWRVRRSDGGAIFGAVRPPVAGIAVANGVIPGEKNHPGQRSELISVSAEQARRFSR